MKWAICRWTIWEPRFSSMLVSARYERGSIILTSNKSYGEWGSIFGDSIIATAILDRLLHHSTTINIRGESYRLKDRRKGARTGRGGGRGSFLGLGLRYAQRAPKDGAGLHSVRGQGGPFMRFRGGEFSTGTTGNFQPVRQAVTGAGSREPDHHAL